MKRLLFVMLPPLLTATVALGQEVQPLPEGRGISFKLVMNVVFGVLALVLLGLGIWYFKLKRDNE
jgi:hypothetical protein